MALPAELAEVWAWYVLGVFVLALRYIARIRTVGVKGLQGDDFMSIGTLCFFTMDAATVTVVYYTGQNVGITEEMIPSLTAADIARLEYGSKVELSAWYSYATLLWCMKFTMLFFYKRITTGTSYHKKLVTALFWFNGLAYTIAFIVISTGCYPIQKNWQVVPIPPWKCSFRPQNCLSIVILNVLTDASLLSIPIPMLWKLKVPLKKKIVIGLILSSGVFVIAAAIIRAVLSLDTVPSASNINRWGVRETIIGLITVNVPVLRPLFSRAFWKWGPYDPSASKHHNTSSYGTQTRSKTWKGTDSHMHKGDLEMGVTTIKTSPVGSLSNNSSQENILGKDNKNDGFVSVQTTYEITSHQREDTVPSNINDRSAYNGIGVPR
ncbi:hypothetical protein MBLNU459_g0142t1 [Dothideomycetes sp. NU459]